MVNDLAKRLLVRLRELREARNLSQEAFAEKAGLKYKHYQSIEAGRKPNVQLPTLIKIAEALGLELWQLFDFDYRPPITTDGKSKRGNSRAGASRGRSRS